MFDIKSNIEQFDCLILRFLKFDCFSLPQKEVEEWRRPKNYNKALGEAQHLIENADLNKVLNTYLIFYAL